MYEKRANFEIYFRQKKLDECVKNRDLLERKLLLDERRVDLQELQAELDRKELQSSLKERLQIFNLLKSLVNKME